MADAEELQKDDNSFIMPRFNTVYNLVMEQVRFKEPESARKSYARLVQLYNDVSSANVSYIDRQDAYQKLRAAHQQVFRPSGVITFGNVIIPITLVIVVLIVVFFLKPQLVGVTGFFTADSAPEWKGPDEFSVSGKTEINLAKYFSDSDKLSYISTDAENLGVFVSGSRVMLMPDEGISGVRYLTFAASDSKSVTQKQVKILIE